MKSFAKNSLLFCFFLYFGTLTGSGQTNDAPPFWKEIQAFKKSDSILMPPQGKILLIGSSSFTYWKDVSHYLPGYPLINRGFGGSSLPHLIRYFDDIVTPYKPRQILIYCGENDLGGTITGDTVFSRFKTLFNMLRNQNKKAKITYISMKPSPSRAHLMAEMRSGNQQIREWLKTKKRTSFVDVYTPMTDSAGAPLEDIFLDDKLHMNAKGYTIWAKEIAPHLLK